MAEKQHATDTGHHQKDHVEKVLEAFPDVFADIGNNLLFKSQVIRPEEVRDGPTESIYKAADGQNYAEQRRDVVKYVNNAGIQLAMVGMENQSTSDKDMAIRIMGYDYVLYRDQITHGSMRYPVITAVLYFGDKRWNVAQSLSELMDIPEELKDQFVDYRINLIDVPRLTKEERGKLVSDFKVVADYFAERNEPDYVADPIKDLDHPREVVDFLRVFTGDERFGKSQEVVETRSKEGRPIRMCDLFDKAEAKGEAKGEIKGEAKGEVKGAKRINDLNIQLAEAGRIDDIIKAAKDEKYQNELLKEYGLAKD